jgi:hypothetical protein
VYRARLIKENEVKVWISKCALSDGIQESIARQVDTDTGWVRTEGYYNMHKLGRDCHETREAAVKAANQMRIKKIASLKKQIAKLEAMKFE